MKQLQIAISLIAGLALLAVSALMNWRFGFSLGTSPFDSHAYGIASLAADLLKVTTPFITLHAFLTKQWVRCTGACALLIICILYSITATVGFAETNRVSKFGAQANQVNSFLEDKQELKRLKDRRGWLPQHRGVEVVSVDLSKALTQQVRIRGKRKTISTATKDCAAVNWVSRKYCPQIFDLKKELAVAEDAKQLDAQINQIQIRLSHVNGGVASGVADPQISFLKKLTKLSDETLQIFITLLVVVLTEAGSVLGPFTAVALLRNKPEAPNGREKTQLGKPLPLGGSARVSNQPSGVVIPFHGARRDEELAILEQWFNSRVSIVESPCIMASKALNDFKKHTGSNIPRNVFYNFMRDRLPGEKVKRKNKGTYYFIELKEQAVGVIQQAA